MYISNMTRSSTRPTCLWNYNGIARVGEFKNKYLQLFPRYYWLLIIFFWDDLGWPNPSNVPWIHHWVWFTWGRPLHPSFKWHTQQLYANVTMFRWTLVSGCFCIITGFGSPGQCTYILHVFGVFSSLSHTLNVLQLMATGNGIVIIDSLYRTTKWIWKSHI